MSPPLVQIPVINFAPFISGDADSQYAVAHQIYQACHEIGFMYLINLGIDSNLISQIFTQSKYFFDLPWEVKKQLSWSDEFSNLGYVSIERERLNPNQPGDLKEAFNLGINVIFEAENNKKLINQAPFILKQWLLEQKDFCQTVVEFYQACTQVSDQLCKALAIALNLPKSFFLDRHNQHPHTLRLLHYPPLTQLAKPGQVRAGEHSDYGSFTLLFQDEVGGLEVCTAQGEWIGAPYIPDTIIVNTGDLMQRWTNHIFCSTKHRVRIPIGEQIQYSRYSVAFFCHPNDDTDITCLETCTAPDFPPRYPTITAGNYLLSRLQATY